ncbi:hypothetical protein M501DRAFT_963514, partial [Patellaria atrata CBS 101060]
MWVRPSKKEDKDGRKKSEASSRRRAESIVSSASSRNPARTEERSTYSTSRNSYPTPSSVASSYATAATRPSEFSRYEDAQSQSGGAYDDGRRFSEREGERRRDRSSSRDRKRDRKDRSRSRDRDSKSKDKYERPERPSRKSTKEREKNRSEVLSRAGDVTTPISAAAGFTQFPGQFGAPTSSGPPPNSNTHTQMSSLVSNQFPGQNPTEYTAAYQAPGTASGAAAHNYGAAADYYGDQGQSVLAQPGVRPSTPVIIHNADPHLMSASLDYKPPQETGSGSAADYYGTGDSHPTFPSNSASGQAVQPQQIFPGAITEEPSPLKPPRPEQNMPGAFAEEDAAPIRPPRPSEHKPNKLPSAAAIAGGAALGFALDHGSSNSQTHTTAVVDSQNSGPYPHVSTAPLPHIQGHSTMSAPPLDHPHVSSLPGAFPCSPPQKPPRPGKSDSSNLPLYAAGAAGLAAYGMHHNHSHNHSNHHSFSGPSGHVGGASMQFASGMTAMRHQHRGPVSKFVDWWKDYEDVRKMEEYTEYIGVCKDCFDSRTSLADAPRKHHYHGAMKRRSTEFKTGRIEKKNSSEFKAGRFEKQHYLSDTDRRKSSSKTNLASGVAGIGLAKVGQAIFNSNKDFDDTYSIRSGREYRNRSSIDRHRSRSRSSDRKSHTSRGVVRHRSRSRDRKSPGGTSSGKDYKIIRRRSRSRSRSHSHDRKSAAFATAGALGAAALASSAYRNRSQSRPSSPRGKHVRRRRSSSDEDRYGAGRYSDSKSFRSSKSHRSSGRSSVNSSYIDISRTSGLAESTGIFGGFFSSPSTKKQHKVQSKKKKGFFNFGNSSSSSSEGLAYGFGMTKAKSKPKRKGSSESMSKPKRKSSDEKINDTLLALGGTAAALAAGNRYKNKPAKYKPEVVAVRESKNRPHHDRTYPSHKPRHGSSSDFEDEWEDALDDSNSSDGIDDGLTYGYFDAKGKARKSQESLLSNDSGTSKWLWRWGSKKKRKPSIPQQDSSALLVGPAIAGGIAGAAMSHQVGKTIGTTLNRYPSVASSVSSIQPPMQTVFPVSTSDPNNFDAIKRTGSTSSSQTPLVVTQPNVPIQGPQPVAPVSSNVYTTSTATQPPQWTTPTGPPVFSTVGPSKLHRETPFVSPKTTLDNLQSIPSTFDSNIRDDPYSTPRRRTESTPGLSDFTKNAAIAGVAAGIGAGLMSGKKDRLQSESLASGVRFDLTQDQIDKERRESAKPNNRQQEEEENRRLEEEARLVDRRRREEEDNRRRVEEFRLTERRRREEEDARRQAEEARVAENRRRQEEEARRRAEELRIADLHRRDEEEARVRAEEARLAERRRQEEEDARRRERELIVQQEAEKRIREQRAKEEDERRARERYDAEESARRARLAREEAEHRAELERQTERIRLEREAEARVAAARELATREEAERLHREHENARLERVRLERELYEHEQAEAAQRAAERERKHQHLEEQDQINREVERRNRELKERERIVTEPYDGSWKAPLAAGVAGVAAGTVIAAIAEPPKERGHDSKIKFDEDDLFNDEIFDPDYFKKNKPTKADRKKQELVRQAANKVVADLEQRYAEKPQNQADFFTPEELKHPSDEAKTHVADPNADVQIYRISPHISPMDAPSCPPYGPSYNFTLPKSSSTNYMTAPSWDVPTLNLIEPTPPASRAGSVRGDKSAPPSPDVRPTEPEPVEQVKDVDTQRKQRNSVTWGENRTLHYEARTPESFQDQYVSEDDLKRDADKEHGEIVVEVDSPTSGMRSTSYKPDPTLASERSFSKSIASEIPVYESHSPPVEPVVVTPGSDPTRKFYQSPFFETVSDLGTDMAIPLTGPGFVEEEPETPTQSEKIEHMPGGFFEADEQPKLSKKERKKLEKAAERETREKDTVLEPTPVPVAESPPVDVEGYTFDSSRGKKKKGKLSKKQSRGQSPSTPISAPEPPTPVEPEPVPEFLPEDEWAPSSSKKKGKKSKRGSLERDIRDLEQTVTTAPEYSAVDEYHQVRESRDKSLKFGADFDSHRENRETSSGRTLSQEPLSGNRSEKGSRRGIDPLAGATAGAGFTAIVAEAAKTKQTSEDTTTISDFSHSMPGGFASSDESNGDRKTTNGDSTVPTIDNNAKIVIPSNAFENDEDVGDLRTPKSKKKSKRRSGKFGSSTTSSPLRSEVQFEDYIGSEYQPSTATSAQEPLDSVFPASIPLPSAETEDLTEPAEGIPEASGNGTFGLDTSRSFPDPFIFEDTPTTPPKYADVPSPESLTKSSKDYPSEEPTRELAEENLHAKRARKASEAYIFTESVSPEQRHKDKRRESEKFHSPERNGSRSERFYKDDDYDDHKRHKHRRRDGERDNDTMSVVSEGRYEQDDKERRKHRHRRHSERDDDTRSIVSEPRYGGDDYEDRKRHKHRRREGERDDDTRSVKSEGPYGEDDYEERKKHKHHRREGERDVDTRSIASESRLDEDEESKRRKSKRGSNRSGGSNAIFEPGDLYEREREHKPRPRSKNGDFDDTASIFSAPAKPEKRGGIFGFFSGRKSTESLAESSISKSRDDRHDNDDRRERKKKHRERGSTYGGSDEEGRRSHRSSSDKKDKRRSTDDLGMDTRHQNNKVDLPLLAKLLSSTLREHELNHLEDINLTDTREQR